MPNFAPVRELARILVIDDHEDSRTVAQMLLEHAGYAVSTASAGDTGYAAALADPPDLILMDLVMPMLDGYEAARRLRRDPRTRDVRIIAVTAQAHSAAREEAILAGCDAFVAKPYRVAALRTLVFEQLLHRRGAALAASG